MVSVVPGISICSRPISNVSRANRCQRIAALGGRNAGASRNGDVECVRDGVGQVVVRQGRSQTDGRVSAPTRCFKPVPVRRWCVGWSVKPTGDALELPRCRGAVEGAPGDASVSGLRRSQRVHPVSPHEPIRTQITIPVCVSFREVVLKPSRGALDRLATLLRERETLDGAVVSRVLAGEETTDAQGGTARRAQSLSVERRIGTGEPGPRA